VWCATKWLSEKKKENKREIRVNVVVDRDGVGLVVDTMLDLYPRSAAGRRKHADVGGRG